MKNKQIKKRAHLEPSFLSRFWDLHITALWHFGVRIQQQADYPNTSR